MKIDHSRCVGCGNCVIACPMGAIYVEEHLAYINDDECVECGACLRFATPEGLPPWPVRLGRRLLEFLRLCYDQPLDVCPTTALYQEQLAWPRSLRQFFSDPTVAHPTTGIKGRGIEEIKTNDVTERLKPGEVGILIEFGRPGIGAHLYEVEFMTQALAPLGVRFEPKNPITQLMTDVGTGELDPAVLNEKVLSCILEVLVCNDGAPKVLKTISQVAGLLHTVVSLAINARCGPNGEAPYEELVAEAGLTLSPNGKTNLGLGLPAPSRGGQVGRARA